MADGVLMDTSFLISFVDPGQPFHNAAEEYFKRFVGDGIPMFLSTIVISEFCLRQPIDDLLSWGAFVVLPFNLEDAKFAAKLDFRQFKGNVPRVSLKDDFKILGQLLANDIAYLATSDEGQKKMADSLRQSGKIKTWTIPIYEGFSTVHFDPAKQTSFI